MKELLVATGNRGKYLEIEALLRDAVETFYSLEDFPEIRKVEEDGATFEENAIKKGRSAALATGKPVIADDSGLEVDALDGAPGVHSARYGGQYAQDAQDSNDARNNQKLLQALAGVPAEKRGARFVCVLALCAPATLKGGERLFRGECAGRIAFAPKGADGFGYDPLFFHPPLGRTFAELDRDAKGRVSHRGEALKKLAAALPSLFSSLTSGEQPSSRRK